MRWILLFLLVGLGGCHSSDLGVLHGVNVRTYGGVEKLMDFDFICAHERIPDPDATTDALFRYARWLEKNNLLKQEGEVYEAVERLYRVAAENGHHKANINLQLGRMRGNVKLRPHEQRRMNQRLIESEVATGYYFIATFLNRGHAGLDRDPQMALRYYKEGALKGSAYAQNYLADRLAPVGIAPDMARKLRLCAAEQGHGDAALALGTNLSVKKNYRSSLEAFQLGVAAGNSTAAAFLSAAFEDPHPGDRLNYLGQEKDLERADRYMKITRILSNYSYAGPKVPEINDIAPLPPAKLPPWDGKLQWLEERLANVPPPKPSEALIRKLAKEKGLDPATGKPMPGSPAFSAFEFPLDRCRSGEPCPVEGHWKVMWPDYTQNAEEVRHFNEGDVMPTRCCDYRFRRFWPLPDQIIKSDEAVTWGLMG